MPPAYFVIHNRVDDREQMGEYLAQVMATMAPYDPELVVMDESSEVVEGATPFPRTVILKFESREKAMAWYNCAEYAAVRPLRLDATEGFGVIVDGFVPPGT